MSLGAQARHIDAVFDQPCHHGLGTARGPVSYTHLDVYKRQYPELAAAVPFYGRQAKPEDVPRIKAPLLLHFAETDANVNATWPAYEAALKAAGKTYEAHVYPGTGHGFHNDSTPRYDEAAAKLAWERTLAWFRTHLA